GGQKSATMLGMPMPRFTNSPPLSSAATLMAMSSLGIRSLSSRTIALTSKCLVHKGYSETPERCSPSSPSPRKRGEGRAAARVRSLLLRPQVDNPVHEDARCAYLIGADLARLHQLIYLRDGDAGGGGHGHVEVARGVPVDQVA